MLKIRRPLGRLIFNMGIAIPGKTVFLIETAPWTLSIGGAKWWYTTVNFGLGMSDTKPLHEPMLLHKQRSITTWLIWEEMLPTILTMN